jgi:hypothetical protein
MKFMAASCRMLPRDRELSDALSSARQMERASPENAQLRAESLGSEEASPFRSITIYIDSSRGPSECLRDR